ncbi:class I SAM-dependent methyltransferase [Glutamicibacter protophormiae]|uniref:class I SAM-dependent methyltransferase n=1 Tax=Glutamicibacter protophormiae TaxID=37930 RepID=UPI002A8220B1|nr:class I SAM-dependent methyltransferase [Glutamicibacter protophormiae]WPR65444.1 class I SAM-dependent methyltransferase [Glutamicibacter protophormiae]WPR68942.1 class I SAM-dependent methyltransferase [Glutamicibacter protophormiae]
MDDYDLRLVELYDDANPDGPDHEFYRLLADEKNARSILDVGCGTGILTATFVRPGRTVVGIDPSRNMINYAAERVDGRAVRWILGDSRDIPHEAFDYAVMTGNVAQHIPDGDWERTLKDINTALRDRGVLAFESRNPNTRAWENWAAEDPRIRDTMSGPVREWTEASETAPGQVRLTSHNLFMASGHHVVEQLVLAFRDRQVIQQQLADAGFVVDGVWSDWNRTPCTDDSPLMVFEAHRE